MDFSTIINLPEFREENFRTPLGTEQKLGLWVDRIGKKSTSSHLQSFRKLGQYALIAIESGSGKLITQSTGPLKINPGDAFIHMPEEPTCYYPDHFWTETWIVFNGNDILNLEQTGFLHPSRTIFKNGAGIVTSAYNNLLEIINSEDVASILKRKIITLNAITLLYEIFRGTDANTNNLIVTITDHIHKNVTAKTSVSQLAEQFNLSETHFRRIFKKYTGVTPKDFIIAVQISKAKQLLASGYTIKQVAQQIGFDDVCYFMRIFKKHTSFTAKKFQSMCNINIFLR